VPWGDGVPAVKALAFPLMAALLLAWSAATAGAAVRCGVRGHTIPGIAGSHVVFAQGDVVVYRVRDREFDTYWACGRRHGRRVLMGRDDSYYMRNELYGPTKAFGEIRIAGEWVTAIHEEDNSPECGKYGETGCEGRSTTLVIVNVALAVSAHEGIYFAESETARWLLSREGGVAWLSFTEDELHGCAAEVAKGRLACPERSLWSGHVDPNSIHLSGTTLTWNATDGAHSGTV
jgi:hypothetical protein